MIRLLLLGSLSLVLAVSFQNRWLEIHWDRVLRDINMPFLAPPQSSSSSTAEGQVSPPLP